MGKLGRICFSLLVLSAFSVSSLSAQEELFEVHGRVVDYLNKPVARAHVILRDRQTGKTRQATSDRQGRFALFHPDTAMCSLEVIPDIESGLCGAVLAEIPGNQKRHISVQLQHGFLVTGKVVEKGKGLKGLEIKVLPNQPHENAHDSVHGGGFATTSGDGSYRLLLTPGHKTMLVQNHKYSKLPASLNHSFTVTGDTKLPDLILSQ